MLSLLKFWKEGIIVLLAGLLWFSYSKNSLLNEEVKMNKTQYQEMKGKYEDAQHQLDIINQGLVESAAKLKASEEQRRKIISTLNTQIINLRNQAPPKDCQKAIDWAVQQKDDLKWGN